MPNQEPILPLLWEDKVNSPSLEAWFIQFGVTGYLSAEEINQLRDAINQLFENGPSPGGGGSVKPRSIAFGYNGNPTLQLFANILNAKPQFIIADDELPLYYFYNVALSAPGSPAVYKPSFRIFNRLGPGTYGIGRPAIEASDLMIVSEASASIDEIETMEGTQIINLGEIGAANPWAVLNSKNPKVSIQNFSVGNRLIKTLVSGASVRYLFLGEGGDYGVGGKQSTAADFSIQSGEIPNQYVTKVSQGIATITGNGIIETLTLPNVKHLELLGTITEVRNMVVGDGDFFQGFPVNITNKQATSILFKKGSLVQLVGDADKTLNPTETLRLRLDNDNAILLELGSGIPKSKLSEFTNDGDGTAGSFFTSLSWIKNLFFGAFPEKSTPLDNNDRLVIGDSADVFKTKYRKWSDILILLRTLFQTKDTQIEVNGNITLGPQHNGKTLIVTANAIITVPAELPEQFFFEYIVKKTISLNWAITTPFIWYLENPPATFLGSTYRTKGTFLREFATNNIHLE